MQAVNLLDTNHSLLIRESSYAVYKMLYIGAKNQNSELVNKLVKQPDTQEAQQEILFEFVRESDCEVVSYLISQGIDVNIKNESNVTALHIACGNNDYDMVIFLLSYKNIDFNIASILGSTPLQTAATRVAFEDGNENILKKLLDKYQETSTELSNDILLDVDSRLQHGPDYIEDSYREYVESLGKNIEWPSLDLSEISW